MASYASTQGPTGTPVAATLIVCTWGAGPTWHDVDKLVWLSKRRRFPQVDKQSEVAQEIRSYDGDVDSGDGESPLEWPTQAEIQREGVLAVRRYRCPVGRLQLESLPLQRLTNDCTRQDREDRARVDEETDLVRPVRDVEAALNGDADRGRRVKGQHT
ncbi:unnamed protein product [Trichogramma brassicae]|uniref:Uncharacterized protein n=1 Tax=Trichogramma brassicae TaxID=86971 RepID=A0A6H5IYH0_9HYME|nr:unnamed protein product [Trichogramma brassicae]